MVTKKQPPKPRADATSAAFFWWEGDTLVVNILGKPGARRDVIGEPKGKQLKVSVTAPPDKGRATEHMLRFLADEFGVSKSAVTLVFGETSVNKQIRIKAPKKLPAVFGKQDPA